MTQTKKYKSYGVLRKNNLADIQNKEEALNNLLNNLSGVDPSVGITFISQDLDAIRGLKNTDIGPDDFSQLAGTTVNTIQLDANGNVVFDPSGNPISAPINPLIRLKDSFQRYRTVTEDPPAFSSGRGPKTYFIPSNLFPTSFTKASNIDTEIGSNLSDPDVQVSYDFWAIGEFYINDRIRVDFSDEYGGILWEGYYIPNPAASIHTFSYETSGLFHVEYDRFDDGNWEVLKSIYAKQRTVTALNEVISGTSVTLVAGDGKYVSVGDFLSTDVDALVTALSGDTVTLSKEISVAANGQLTFDMSLGESTTFGQYTINEILDRGETPQMKKRILWWFPNSGSYSPDYKYLRNTISGRTVYEFFFLNAERASITPAVGSVRELLDNAITPSQDEFTSEFRSTRTTTVSYEPKPFLTDITKATINITFDVGNRSFTADSPNLENTELGNYIIPTAVGDFDVVIPKGTRIKDLLGSNVISNARLVNTFWSQTAANYPVSFIDHRGLVDYFVVSTSGDVVDIIAGGTTDKLKTNMYCVFNNLDQFIRITEIISPTSFRTSSSLGLTNSYIYVYANAGIVDRSLDLFCSGVFGRTTATEAISGSNTIEVTSIDGITPGMTVQFAGSIPIFTSILNITGTTLNLSNSLTSNITQGETVVFLPVGVPGLENREICVLPLDLSPPFVGVNTGLDANGKNIKSGQATLNVKFNTLTINGAVSSATTSENYDRKIDLANTTLSIIAKRVV